MVLINQKSWFKMVDRAGQGFKHGTVATKTVRMASGNPIPEG